MSQPWMPPGIVQIAIVNESTVLSDADVLAAIPSLQMQVTWDFAPLWHRHAILTFFSGADRASVPPTSWWIVILDTADMAGALGYHDMSPSGLPMAKVFAKTAADGGYAWTVTTSHEMLEQLVNPYVNREVFMQSSNTAGTIYDLEVGDAVEADALGYRIRGVLVSNFVTPAWFDGWRQPGSAKFDFGGVLTAPLSLARGGYCNTFTVTGGGFSQQAASHAISTLRPVTGSRSLLRAVPPGQRRVSVLPTS